MNFTTLFFDKGGIKKDIPGFTEYFSSSELGFWGEYTFLDFALFIINPDKSFFICDREIRKNINNILMKWDEKNYDFFTYQNDFDTVKNFLNKIEDEIIIFYDINFAAVAETDELKKAVDDFADDKKETISKISINSVPVDIYIADKNYLVQQMDILRNRIQSDSYVFDFIIEEILATGFEEIRDLKGEILFNSSVNQFLINNLSLLNKEAGDIMDDFMKYTPPPHEKESFIGKKGEVVNSVISSNSRIDGYVENSVIFSGVTVKQNAVIKNSVIMNGNQIGKFVNIENSIILPNLKQQGNNSNIQDRSIIGGKSRVKNKDYPEHIFGGITVIGMNSTIPVKFVAEPGSLIGADVTAARLKELKKVKKSGSVI